MGKEEIACIPFVLERRKILCNERMDAIQIFEEYMNKIHTYLNITLYIVKTMWKGENGRFIEYIDAIDDLI